MLSTNVLCLKKRKKRSYHVADTTGYDYKEKIPMSVDRGCNNNKSTTMLQITEDTPPDMLAGAMDLIVHLPNGNSVKMSVERSTPMMDLLVQITTNHHLQLSGYTLQPLEMAPSPTTGGYCNDKILPFKPNTPIGVLDTQHVRVVPKIKTIPKTLQKSISIISNHNNNNNINNGYHQPFESTFRLKVYLPRNQLYVTRISQNVYLEDILKKVCDEKHLDPQKYEFRHPGNLDEILDPKLTLSDYQITELHLVLKGTIGLQQTYPTSDLMSLRKEEERKQMHNKTGGGVFNLIFRRGKASSGSVSSENRSISPTHSDDSRSVTPPAQSPPPAPQTTTTTATVPTPASSIASQPKDTNDKPKPPQRKRRPAPKPPQIIETKENPTTTTTITQITVAKAIETTTTTKKLETGLTICHSRNSSDSSGYHEASVLSDNCGNTSLPRRPKSTAIETNDDNNNKNNKITGKFSQSTSNLSRMSVQSKSTSSLSVTGRKKKSAPPPPPPPPVAKQTDSTSKPPSPVIASQTITNTATNHENQKIQDLQGDGPVTNPNPPSRLLHTPIPAPRNKILKTTHKSNANHSTSSSTIENQIELNIDRETELKPEIQDATNIPVITQNGDGVEELTQNQKLPEIVDVRNDAEQIDRKTEIEIVKLPEIVDNLEDRSMEQKKPPEIIGVIPKNSSQSMFDSLTRKRGFQIGTSLLNGDSNDDTISVNSAVNSLNYTDNDDDLLTNDELFDGSVTKATDETILNQLHGIHDYDEAVLLKSPKKLSVSSLRSAASIPAFLSNTNIKKWDNKEELNQISVQSTNWVIGGDDCKTDSSDSIHIQKLDDRIDEKPFSNVESSKKTETVVVDTVDNGNNDTESFINGDDFETDWQYQLPSPPKAFRDSSPPPSTLTNCNDNLTIVDSVVTSPELFEKLQSISDHQTDKTSNYSDIDDNKSILNKLSLEHLEKRKSLVYNRELATSLKQERAQQQQQPEMKAEQTVKKATKSDEDYVNTLLQFERTLDELQQKTNTSSQQSQREQQQFQQQKNEIITKSTLPNFKITTYDNPKQKVNIFEDDTVRSNRKLNDNNNDNSNKNVRTEIRRNSNDGKSTNLLRTESFQQNYWSPSKPVIRSKSSIALNKYNQPNNRIADDDEDFNKFHNNEENLTKSNSLFDVSGLQSLGVMRLIQSKLNTPRNSIDENLNTVDYSSNNENNKRNYQKQSDDKTEVQNINNSSSSNNNNINNNNNNNTSNNNNNNNNKTEKSQQYITKAPSINMGTWSERPKVPVNLKDDPDYKFNTNNNNNRNRRISPVFNINNNNNGVNVRISSEYKNVSIKVNGSEPISAENTGNVVIKIGEQQFQQQQSRKPLGNINKIETTNKQRPHSIAFDSDFNISRLPIVRSVELKKPYKDLQQNNNNINNNNNNNNNNNTSVTQISDNKTNELNKYSNVYRSHEALHVQQQPQQQQQQQIEPKFRLNSFLQKSAPVVRGFRTNDIQRFSWNQPHSYSSTLTLNNKEKPSTQQASQQLSTFQVNLRRTESTKRHDNDKKMMPPPPPPPAPSFKPPSKSTKFVTNNNSDPKEQLLQAIRDFGGKKGLRAVKA